MGSQKRNKDRNARTAEGKTPVVTEARPSGIVATWDAICRFAARRTVIIAASLLLLAAVFVRYAEPLSDPDLWWHMALGDYMLKHHTLRPDHSIYSWTVADPNWIYNGWIPQMFYHLLYATGGTALLHISQYLFFGAVIALFLYFNYCNNELLNLFYLLAILAVMVCLHLNASLLKPEMFSIVFMTLTPFIYFYSLSRGKNLFWLYPIIMLLWVNSHGGFIFGLAFIGAAFAGELLNYFFKRQSLSKGMLRSFLVSVVLSIAATIITPYGPQWVLSIIGYFSDPHFMGQARELIAYKSIFLFDHPAKYILMAFAVLYGVLSIFLLVSKRYFNISLVIVNVLFVYLSFMYARSAYLYLPVWYFSMAYLISLFHITPRLSRLAPVFLLVFILSSVWTMHWAVNYPQKYRYFGFGVGEYMPSKVADFMLTHKVEGPLFNTYEIGGYLLWRLYPRYRVFIDPRHGPYTRHLSDEYRQFELGNNFEQFTAKYPFKSAVVKLEWIVLFRNFFKSPDWKLVYFDSSSALFVHKSVLTPDLRVDLGPERFKDLKSYESYVYVLYAYLNMNDFKSVWRIMDMMESRFNYGMQKELIAETRNKVMDYERLQSRK
ncbi:MAG: hypothetical protein M1508_02850 [Nitrospirae bacterium]|nr:hypothetical protein [Nitrospirota bacterium]